ncbi:tryptophan synthase subunit alpha [Thalassolituus sp.]|uniref:tryptophan synthase subunit alpha n=1 Tax=Thalassolituus sp. TaxID=2030822 RepID=UPI003512DBAE
MTRISKVFDTLASQGKKALIPYITAGDPDKETTVPMMHALVEAGADVIELGVPFSDPMADGPTIQLACERALAHGTSLRDVLAMVAEFRKTDQKTAVVLMGYLNPVEAMGYETFVSLASESGVDGVLIVDMPPEETAEVDSMFEAAGIDFIYLLAPTSTEERIKTIGKVGRGYVYYVSLRGVTGSAAIDVDDVLRNLDRIREHVVAPLCVGFGIQNAEAAARVAAVCDGVIVGSALVSRIADQVNNPPQAITDVSGLAHSMREAMDA